MRTRCLFVVPSLRGGGAERVTTILLQHLERNVSDLHLAAVQMTGPHVTDLPDHVTVHDLGAQRTAYALPELVRTIRRLRPHVVFSTISHMNLAVALTRPLWPRGTRLLLRETSLTAHLINAARFPAWRRGLYRQLYPRADMIVCQTPYMRVDLQRAFKLPACRLTVIPNPVDFEAIDRAASDAECPITGQGPHVVALGRLRPVKGTERLLNAFPKLAQRHPTAQLWLLGDGPCERSLRAQANWLGIADRVHFVGYQSNPFAWLRAADLMAVCSRGESSSNAILEAVACGCPTVARRHPGGTYGMLSHLGLANRFVRHLDSWDDNWFRALPPQALARARAHHGVQRVTQQYAHVLQTGDHRNGRWHKRNLAKWPSRESWDPSDVCAP